LLPNETLKGNFGKLGEKLCANSNSVGFERKNKEEEKHEEMRNQQNCISDYVN